MLNVLRKLVQYSLLSVASCTLLSANALAQDVSTPTFDCAAATTTVEKLICSDTRLGRLDVELLKVYRLQMASSADPAELKASQKAWIKQRNRCQDVQCVTGYYERRIAELTKSSSPPETSAPVEQAENGEVAATDQIQQSRSAEVCLSWSTPPEQAVKACTDALKTRQNYPSYLAHRSQAHLALNSLEQAIADATLAIEGDAKLALAYFTRGVSYARKNEPQKALNDLSQSIHIDPTVDSALAQRSVVYMELGDDERAIQDAERSLSLNPNNIQALATIGLSEDRRGNPEKALNALDRALQIDPNASFIINRRAEVIAKIAARDQRVAAEATSRTTNDTKGDIQIGSAQSVSESSGAASSGSAVQDEAPTAIFTGNAGKMPAWAQGKFVTVGSQSVFLVDHVYLANNRIWLPPTTKAVQAMYERSRI